MRKYANIDFSCCNPRSHDPEKGICVAAQACRHNLLEQEGPFEGPMLISASMCVGCGDCSVACPCNAITIARGM